MAVTRARVDWALTAAAAGPAVDVPGQLIGLDSPLAKTRKAACARLWGSLCNQGSVYPASLAAVPDLVARVRAGRTQDKHAIVELLVGIAVGDHANHLDGALSPARFAGRASRPATSLEGRCHGAVAAAAGVFRARLGDRDARTRAAAAFALAWFRDDDGASARALGARARVERDAAAKASMVISLGHLAALDARAWIASLDAETAVSPVRTAAAIATVYLDGRKASPETRAVLAAASRTAALRATAQSWNGGDLADHARRVLATLPARTKKTASRAPDFVAALAKLSYARGQARAATLVDELFPGATPRRTMAALTEHQRTFLATLMTEGLGTPGGALDAALRRHGLPGIEALPAMTGIPRQLHRDYRRR